MRIDWLGQLLAADPELGDMVLLKLRKDLERESLPQDEIVDAETQSETVRCNLKSRKE